MSDDDDDLEDEVGLVLAAIDDERPVSGISSNYKRPSSIATSATIVHVHKRDPRPIMIPTVRDQRSQVIYHDKLASTYHTIIKVLLITTQYRHTTSFYEHGFFEQSFPENIFPFSFFPFLLPNINLVNLS